MPAFARHCCQHHVVKRQACADESEQVWWKPSPISHATVSCLFRTQPFRLLFC